MNPPEGKQCPLGDSWGTLALVNDTDDTSPSLREEQQAAALRQVADLGERRAALLRQADELLEPLKKAAVNAARLGADRRRTQDLARVGYKTFYGWLRAAGVEVRAKRPATKRADD
jgi:hypothetical protein